MSTRATALPPTERRAAIIDTTLPLLIEHGPTVTTRQIAEAAGIAEGTIFRVFPDKDKLIEAVIERAFDPEPTDTALAAIDDLPLDDRLVEAVRIIQQRVARIWRLMLAIGSGPRPTNVGRTGPPDLTQLARLFEPDRDQLRRKPMVAAQLLWGLALASSHPMLSVKLLPPNEVVSVVLDGIRTAPPGKDTAC